jgi:hypothetical protein
MHREHLAGLLILAGIAIALASCGKGAGKTDRTVEDGVEVVRNRLQPSLRGQASMNLQVEKTVLMDFRSEDIARLGISDIRGFDVDSDRNVYIAVYQGDYRIYKFAPDGSFVLAFARKGEGPGEMIVAKCLNISERGEITVFESRLRRLFFFDDRGQLLRDISCPAHTTRVDPLVNGNYLVSTSTLETRSPFAYWVNLCICDPSMREYKRLDHLKIPNGPGTSYWVPSGDELFVGAEGSGYEIRVYSLDEKLLRKIRKEYEPVKIPDEIRTAWKRVIDQLKQASNATDDVKVPDCWPPFSAFFIDEEGCLFVRTWEEGPRKGEYVHDIFNPDGVFIGRTSLDMIYRRDREYAKQRGGKIYGFSQDDSGYEQLVEYKLSWNK